MCRTNAIAAAEDEVRELVLRRGLDPTADESALRALVSQVVADHEERSPGGTTAPLGDPQQPFATWLTRRSVVRGQCVGQAKPAPPVK